MTVATINQFFAITLELPFAHTVIGHVAPGNNRQFVAWVRHGDAAHNFGTHEVGPDGACLHGHYFALRSEALLDLFERARIRT